MVKMPMTRLVSIYNDVDCFVQMYPLFAVFLVTENRVFDEIIGKCFCKARPLFFLLKFCCSFEGFFS